MNKGKICTIKDMDRINKKWNHCHIDVSFYILDKKGNVIKDSTLLACIWQIVYLLYVCKLSTKGVYTRHCYGSLI